ncbi:MAG: gliding motility-associated C-terminal domain-containing protein [Bacteroidota bacterium]
MNNFYKSIFRIATLLLLMLCDLSYAQQTIQIYQEDFNSGGANFLLNSGGPSSNSGPNQWIINNNFNGNGSYPNTPDETQTVSGTIAGAPMSPYLHIHDIAASGGALNANYNVATASDNFAQINEDMCTVGLENTILTFFYIGEGNMSDYAELYYSLNSGGSWTQVGMTQYNNQSLWKYEIVTDPIFDNQPTLRFGWRWKNMGVGAPDISIGIEDIIVVSTYDNINNPVTIDITAVAPNPVCAGSFLSIFYSLSHALCDGTYQIQISNSSGNFTGANLGVFNIASGTVSGGIGGMIPSSTPAGTCYKIRIDRLAPPPAITGIASICFEVILCPNTITTLQPVVTFGPDTLCAGSVIDVPFYSTGAFNANNNYIAQLSDANGSFSSPTPLGTFPSSAAYDPMTGSPPGNVSGLVPQNTPPGCNYYIRVVSTSPNVIPPPQNYFGPFCIKQCDNTTNNMQDVHVCITLAQGVDTTISYSINTFTNSTTYGAGNVFEVQLLSSQTYAVLNTGSFGSVASTSSGTLTLTIPNLAQVIALLGAPGTGMYYMRLVATNPIPAWDSLGSLVRLIIGCPDSISPNIIPSDTLICPGDILSLTIGNYNFDSKYQWHSPILNNGIPFYWSYNPLLIQFNTGTPAGTYWFTCQENNHDCWGPISDTVWITVLHTPNVVITAPTPVCQGDTIYMHVPFQTATYYSWSATWGTITDTSNNELYMVFDSVGAVQIHIFALNQCGSATGIKNITVQPRPTVVACNDTTVCTGQPVTLIAVTNQTTIKWTDTANVQLGTALALNVSPDSVTSYIVTVSNTIGCKDRDTVTVFQYPLPEIALSKIDITCPGESDGSISSTIISGTPPFTYEWSTAPVQTTSGISNLTFGNYTVMVTDGNGCENTNSIVVNQPAVIGLSFVTVDPDYGMNNGSATVYASGGTSPYTFVWGTTPTQTGQMISNLSVGTYYVTVTDANGCTAAGEVIIISKGSGLWVPNVFSPNGDGLNDFFNIQTINMAKMLLRVYDRWGELVFETTNPKRGWDGKFKGDPCALGVFVYYVEVEFLDGTSQSTKGNVTLIR